MANEQMVKDWDYYQRYDEKRLKYAIRIAYQEQERYIEIDLLLQEEGTDLLSALSSGGGGKYGIESTLPKSTSGSDSETEQIVQKRFDLEEERRRLEEKRDRLWELINTLDKADEEEAKMRSIIMFIFEGGSFRKYGDLKGIGKSTAERWFARGVRVLLKRVEEMRQATLPQSISI